MYDIYHVSYKYDLSHIIPVSKRTTFVLKMKLYLSILLVLALLLQPLSKFIIVSNYALNVKSITAKYCVNKAKPKLKCQGKCHLKKQLIQHEKQSQSDSNSSNEVNAFHWYTAVSNKQWAPLLSKTIQRNIVYLAKESEAHSHSLIKPPTI